MIDKLTTSLTGKNALICGSTSGMGKAVSKEFAKMGANVTLFSRNEDKLKLVIESMACLDNQNHRFLVGDFNHPDSIQSIINNDISQGSTYHILINNSGGPKGGPIIDAVKTEFLEGYYAKWYQNWTSDLRAYFGWGSDGTVAGAPEDVRQLDLEAVAVGPDALEVDRLQRAPPETFEAAGRISERHAGDDLHVLGRSEAEQHAADRPVDHPDALAVTRAQHEVGILRVRLLNESRDLVRIVGEVAVHLKDKLVVAL